MSPGAVMMGPRVIVALDYPLAAPALALADRLDPQLARLKVGKELFGAAGPLLVEDLMRRGFEVFLDLKFHDIPHTVAGACRAAAALGVWMVNVHALGGRAMMEAAREALQSFSRPPKLLAVTLLTSMAADEMREVGLRGTPAQSVLRLAKLAQASGLDGVVCSAQEASVLRAKFGSGFCLVTPGIRPADVQQDDQQRVVAPRAAIENGAHYLVVGRPITRAGDPLQALRAINAEVAMAQGQG
jgi:orotidine-5'-phosphate decarboxylase